MSEPQERNNIEPHEQQLPPIADSSSSTVGPGSHIGQFKIEQELSRGPMGVVYLAYDTKLDRPVVIKSLPVEVMDNPAVRSRWQREAQLLASVNHPNIAVIYEKLEEAEGVGYLILEYVPGETLAERIGRGDLDLEEALSVAMQIAEAMSVAHDKGVIHRDLKPGNIKITPERKVKVLDFGLAKTIEAQPLDQQSTAVTQVGQVVGTPSYMSPEQALGKVIDHRSDIWSFGCVLYEMLTGKPAFPGETRSDVLESILTAEPDWKALPTEAGPAVRDSIGRCLQKDPERRYQSAAELYQDLLDYHATLTAPAPKALDVKALLRSLRKPRIALGAILVLLVACIAIVWVIDRGAKVRWARVEALPAIERLIEQDRHLAAFLLARQAEKYIPEDRMLMKLWPRICRDYSIITTPPGADIFFKEYSAFDSQWQYLGQSPLENIRFPRGLYRWKITKEGFETGECVAGGYLDTHRTLDKTLHIDLHEEGSLPPGMVLIPAQIFRAYLEYVGNAEAAQTSAYLIDKYEVTNQQFKEFVDKGGYQNRDYWNHEFVKDSNVLYWEQAMREFRDKTGRPGPSTWEGGTYPKGQDRYPVSGVSWYEAVAYAEFVGKSLPTTYHWFTAACTEEAIAIVPFSNFSIEGPAPVGSHPGMGRTGLYDMAGNVKEWCWNATNDSSNHRYILGAAWGEQTYQFGYLHSRSAWDRAPSNGLRCVQYPGGQDSVPDSLFGPVERRAFRDYSTETPVSDEEFQFYKKLYAYDRTELNAVVESVDESSEHWQREKITFDAAYSNERMIAYLFLPKRVKPPYQTVVWFPGGSANRQRSFENLPSTDFTKFVIMSGRALMYPVYKGTYERQIVGDRPDAERKPIAYRDYMIQLSKDLGRSIDYLETRDDIDSEKIAYYGMSWGAWLGPIMLAVEERIKLGIFVVGGFPSSFKLAPAADPIDFAPRVKVPVLMINGKEDSLFPFKTSQIPMYEFLGTDEADKEHKVYPGGHGLLGLFSRQIKGDVLGWLDRYLGPID